MRKLFTLLALSVFLFASCSDDDDRVRITLNLDNELLADGIETAGGKIWKDTYNTGNVNITSQVFTFSHSATIYGTMSYWSGFTVSNSNDNSKKADFLTYQFGCMAKGGKTGEGTPYIVATSTCNEKVDFDESDTLNYPVWIKISEGNNTYKPVGVNITNSPYTYYSVKDGDNYARPFAEGDYYILRIYGVRDDNSKTNPVEFYLADYRNGKTYICDKWEWVDLSGLGNVEYLFFVLDSTDKSYGYNNTAQYFCLDGLTVEAIN